MAVYTKITNEELREHLSGYNIGELTTFAEIIDGIDNSNFIINTSNKNPSGKSPSGKSPFDNKFIFTIFESRIDKNILPYFINLKEHLAYKNIPCPQPIKNNKGENIVDFKGKKSVIVSFLTGSSLRPDSDGYYRNIAINHCTKIGEYLAKMHIASQDFKQQRNNDLNIIGIENLFNNFQPLLPNYDSSLPNLITKTIDFIKANWDYSLPSAPCHLDLFPDNVFFDNEDNISAIIDFYFSANDLFIYDFAITVNAWCFDIHKFNFDKFIALFNAYNNIRNFSKKEIDFMQIALICASMRFLATRLNDYFFTPKNSLVKIKNPNEYKEKLLFFLNNKINL